MFGIGAIEVVILFCVGTVWLGIVTVVVVMARRVSQAPLVVVSQQPPAPPQRPPALSAVPDDADVRQTIIARLTQRFCPQCRAPLAADSPEGLCPACLMAGGLASAAAEPAANGMAITTPPSGSQPPAAGEWTNLQQHFPELEILELLGRGGMGAVYKARQKKLDRIVALKVIPPDAAKDPAFTERFGREARALARLNHPNIVTVYDYSHDGDLCWLLMEYVDGVNLRHTLRASRLEPREALAIVPQICDALQYAHDQGVVHRDIKPENVLLDRAGRVKIADFGLAKLLGKGPDDFTLTRTQQVMGTPRYMAPEQIERPAAVDHRADIYSLGVVIYEMLTGELPLGRFEPPSKKVQIDVRIDEVVLRTLEKEPDRRYQRASQLKTELASATSWPIAAAQVSAAPLRPQPSWHTPAAAAKPAASDPAGVPLNQVLGVAIGMVMGVVVITGGLGAGIYGLSREWLFSGEWWGWAGGAFGSVIGGLGSLFGSYNTYRQMAGAEDLMRSPRVTWFDWVMRGYFVFGAALMALALVMFDRFGNTWPMALIGGIAAFQAALFLMWRLLLRPAAEYAHFAAQNTRAAEPNWQRAVLLPVLAIVSVLVLMAVDLEYASPNYGLEQGRVTPAMTLLDDWKKSLLAAAFVLLPLAGGGLAAWRYRATPVAASDGTWRTPYPFAASGWLWGVAGVAMLALLVPWFRLHVVNNAESVLWVHQAYRPNPGNKLQTLVAHDRELREIGAMPAGFRYAHRGLEMGPAAAACLLVAFATALVSLTARPGRTWRGIFLALCGAMALVLIVALLHDMLRNPLWLAVDDRTERGLNDYLFRLHGEYPQSVAPLLPALRSGFATAPAIGTLLGFVAAGMALFLGVTELCWGPGVVPAEAAVAPSNKAPRLDPVREAVRKQVTGPAIGLMIAGLIGLLPLVIALLVVPAVVVVPRAIPSQPEPRVESIRTGGLHQRRPAAVVAVLRTLTPTAQQPALTLPLLLAQEMPQGSHSTMPTWAVAMPVLALFYLFNLAISITMLVAGWRMRQLKSHGLALVASILAMLPCTFGWIIGLPIGIWSLAILNRADVREAFEA